MSKIYDTIIIGAGIAGLTAAIYAARKRMDFKIISSDFGGQFMVSGEVENYPGIVRTTGGEFSSIMEKQMEFNGIDVEIDYVQEIKQQSGRFIVDTKKGYYEAKTIIVATGSRPRKLNVPGELRLSKRGVTYCSICDGPLFSSMDVAILGGGNSALEAVDFLKDIVRKIYLIVKEGSFSGHEYLQERIFGSPKVEVIFGADTKEILGEKLVSGLRYEKAGKQNEIAVQGVIIEIGRIPNTDIFRGVVDLDEHGHIIMDCQGRTSIPGIFAAGDCASGHEYQYVISAGQGCMALIKASRYLFTKEAKKDLADRKELEGPPKKDGRRKVLKKESRKVAGEVSPDA